MSGATPSPTGLVVFDGVKMADGSVTPATCGPFIVRVRAPDDVVLSDLPDVLRHIGFTEQVRTEGCRDCPQKPTVLGKDVDGREMAITVYPLDGDASMLDAYVDEPRG